MNFRPRAQPELDINLTPLIDVVFLLLIFFMVSTTFQKESQLQIQLPEASETEESTPQKPIELVINAEGRYFLDGNELVNDSLETLLAALRKRARGTKDVPIILRADARTPHQAVITAMDAAAQLGLVNMSIATARRAQ